MIFIRRGAFLFAAAIGLAWVVAVFPAAASVGRSRYGASRLGPSSRDVSSAGVVAGDAYKLVYEAPARGAKAQRVATAGPYKLTAQCESFGGPVELVLAESGPATTEFIGGIDGVNDTSPFEPFVRKTALAAGSGRTVAVESSTSGDFFRTAGTIVLRSRSALVRIDYNAVADARSSKQDCFLYGTVTLARSSSTAGDATALSYRSRATAPPRRVPLATVGPYKLSASCKALGDGGTLFHLLAKGPAGTIRVGGIATGNTISSQGYTYDFPVKAGRESDLFGVSLGNGVTDEEVATLLLTWKHGLIRFDVLELINVGGPHCTLYGTATLAKARSSDGDMQALRFHRGVRAHAKVANSGPYAFKARCRTGSFGVQLDLGEDGPQALDSFGAIDDLDDHFPATLTIGGAVIPAQSPNTALIFPSAQAGRYARHSGMSFLKSGSHLVELQANGTADNRAASRGCALYGTATLAR